MIKLKTPISEDDIRKLKVGDEVLLSGVIVTARDQAHKLMVDEKPDFIRDDLKESVIYHCGPVVKKDDSGKWSFVSAGPTTSIREEPYQADVICEYGVRGVIGKGGMGVVYKAEDTKLKRTVALKFLPQDLTRDIESKKRFIHEAQAASSLEHNNICNIHEID